jgi:OOP family OmpA-OmpF porin
MEKSTTILAILGLLTALVAGPALAQDRGLYLGGSLGHAQYKDTCKRANVPCDERDDAWRFFAGYQFSRHWSAELGYADLGAVRGSGAIGSFSLEVKGWDLSALGSIPIAGGMSAFGRLGAYRVRTTIDQQGGFGTVHDAGTNTGITYGAGIGFNLWRFGLRAEWQRYENAGNSTIGEDDVDVFSVGALFRF